MYSGDDQYLTYDEQEESQDPIEFADAHIVNKADASIHFDSISNMDLVVGQGTIVSDHGFRCIPWCRYPRRNGRDQQWAG